MENQILIFRTSITKRRDIKLIGSLLAKFPQITRWNVDFEDWEKVLQQYHRTRDFGNTPE